MDLTNDDVQDILHLLDSLPAGELHLRTTRFSLSLRRARDGEWTQEFTVLAQPNELARPAADERSRPAPKVQPQSSAPAVRQQSPSSPPASQQESPAPAVRQQSPSPPPAAQPQSPAPAVRQQSPSPPPAAQPQSPAPAASDSAHSLADVRAPLLGTFYRAPRPGAPPFVEVGSRVDEDTVVGIIETMKLMNSVCAGRRGTVAEILVVDAQFAPQGTTLMRIREVG